MFQAGADQGFKRKHCELAREGGIEAGFRLEFYERIPEVALIDESKPVVVADLIDLTENFRWRWYVRPTRPSYYLASYKTIMIIVKNTLHRIAHCGVIVYVKSAV